MIKCSTCGVEQPESQFEPGRGQCKACRKKYNQTYYEKNKLRLKELVKGITPKMRAKVIAELGGKCVRCGFNDPRALQIDHINGGGVKEIRSMRRYSYYLMIHNLPEEERDAKYQCLCANCNWIKRAENNETC